jgi:spore germination cell wall hydrolase CwlJ-like protein
VGLVAVLSYAGFTEAAIGPAYGNVADIKVAELPATLSVSGGKVSINGSVSELFTEATFVGPNRADKRDRARITVDVASFSNSFESSRTRLAALMAPVAEPAAEPVAGSKGPGRRVMVAALQPDSAALDAIDSIVPDQSIPMPETLSSKLAYAREDAPVTTFPTAPEYSSRELWCMASAIYFEARGESYRGQVAVAQVVMNRLKHPLYPKTICGVVFQGESRRNACQFSFACDGRPETVTDKKSWAQAQEIAEKVTSGELYLAEVGKATHYHASYVYPDWAPRLKRVTKIGLHIFYRFKHG